jgi:raffinose/stachyose/melibiose transport system permease protein
VDVWKGVGLATLIYIAGIVSIPQEYFEAARCDGAGPWSNFRHIVLPLARPATVTVIILSLIGGPALVRPDLGDDPRAARASPPTSSRR